MTKEAGVFFSLCCKNTLEDESEEERLNGAGDDMEWGRPL